MWWVEVIEDLRVHRLNRELQRIEEEEERLRADAAFKIQVRPALHAPLGNEQSNVVCCMLCIVCCVLYVNTRLYLYLYLYLYLFLVTALSPRREWFASARRKT
jgi:hypothetical protein